MDDRHYKKRLTTAVVVLGSILAAGLVFVSLSDDGRAFIGGPGSVMGWAVPLAGLFTIAAITWLLILSDSHAGDDHPRRVACWSCGHSVMSEWRLCPYCGAELRAWAPPAGESLDRG
jgi:hypothetical protein